MGSNNTELEENGKESHRDSDDNVITYIGDVPVTNDFIDIIRSNGS